MRILPVLLPLLVACATAAPPPAPSPAPKPAPPLASAEPTPEPPKPEVTVVIDAGAPPPADGAPPPDPFAALPPSLPIPTGPTKLVKRSGKEWPFHKWDHAEAVVLNWADYGPQTSLRVVDDRGWSPHVKYRAALDASRASTSVGLVTKAHGELLVSKCPAPRHAVVLYDGDDPVASINVCFTCNDVLLWPQWPATPTQADFNRAQKLERELLPRWQALFIDDLKLPLWAGH